MGKKRLSISVQITLEASPRAQLMTLVWVGYQLLMVICYILDFVFLVSVFGAAVMLMIVSICVAEASNGLILHCDVECYVHVNKQALQHNTIFSIFVKQY